MIRDRQTELGVKHDVENEPLVISKGIIDLFLKQEHPADLISLYTFYYYTAKWQHTNQTKATTKYTASGLKWTEDRVRARKNTLRELGLIS